MSSDEDDNVEDGDYVEDMSISASGGVTSSGRRKYAVLENVDVLPARMKLLLDALQEFYKNGSFGTVVVPIIRDHNPLALRDIDWLVTNYSLAFPVVYANPKYPNSEPFNIHDSYTQHEAVWKKRLFDPFQRGHRIMFRVEDVDYETTIAQLNFFRWAIEFGVIHWAAQHRDEIREHHQRIKAERKKLIAAQPNREKKRMRLTSADDSQHCLIYVQPMRLAIGGDAKVKAQPPSSLKTKKRDTINPVL